MPDRAEDVVQKVRSHVGILLFLEICWTSDLLLPRDCRPGRASRSAMLGLAIHDRVPNPRASGQLRMCQKRRDAFAWSPCGLLVPAYTPATATTGIAACTRANQCSKQTTALLSTSTRRLADLVTESCSICAALGQTSRGFGR